LYLPHPQSLSSLSCLLSMLSSFSHLHHGLL
jgi:hypothetical protein